MERYHFPPEQQQQLESLPLPMAVYQFVDKRVVTLVISDGFCELFGYTDRARAYEDMDTDMYKYDHPDDMARIADAALRFATEDTGYDVIYRTRNRFGKGYRILHAKGQHVYTEDGVQLAYVWYTDEGPCSESFETREAAFARSLNTVLHEDSLMRANRYDHLTGLPNMTYFFELAETAREQLTMAGERIALLYLDLSGMKFFNHKYGFSAGDRLLQSFAAILADIFTNENCCHLGQGHFGVYTRVPELEQRLEDLFARCEKLNDGNSLPVRVGIFTTEYGDVSVSFAYDMAKLACDTIRDSVTSAYHYYSPELRDNVVRRQYILENLERALAEHWIQVYYQPIVRTVSRKVCDEEALARWIDPELGVLSPADFIPHLEDAGLIYKLDLYVVEQVLEKLRLTKEAGLFIVPHSINLSRSDFDSCDIVEEIRRRVDDAGVDHRNITIEITESIIGSDFDFMKQQIQRFQDLGFPVWMDDFGSGYSSLDVLQSIRFDLLKFDMNFMKKLHEGDAGRIILTELMKMATSLGIDTVCEGVENEEQVVFLQEIGCSKLQGFYYCCPIPFDQLLKRYRLGHQIGYENPEEASYYDAVGRVNLYDFDVIARNDVEYSDDNFRNFFNTLPMGIIEVSGDSTRFVRSNQSYRDFIRRFFGFDLSHEASEFAKYGDAFMNNIVKTCCERGIRALYDEKMPDGSIVHSCARRIGINPVTGNIAVAVAVLSITDAGEGTTYADIARALASDYYNIYYVDMDTDKFIEYTSRIGGEELALERHGEDFFTAARRDTKTRIFEEDRESFLKLFTKENIIRDLDRQGVFTTTYRLIDTGTPMYVTMKITRLYPGSNQIILGVSIIDAQKEEDGKA